MSAERAKEIVVVVGQGYVGLPLAMNAVDAGHDVIGFDVDPARVGLLNDGRSYVEDIADHQVAAALASGRYRAVTDLDGLDGFDIAVVSVPTPLHDGAPDLRHIASAAEALGPHLRPGSCVILESTTYPGTTEEYFGPILAEASGLRAGVDFQLGYSPERIDPGNTTWTLTNTPKVVSGIDQASLDRIEGFFAGIVDTPIPVGSVKVAELTKLLENTFRHVNIALVNELAMFANDLGIDVWEAIDAASTKPFGYLRFTPGPGVGGHCLPVDPSYLSWRVKQALGHSFRFVELANDVNEHMPDYVVTRLIRAMNDRGRPIRGQRIVLLGLAYKRNTGDARESPSTRVAEALVELGADVLAADPHVDPRQVPDGVTLVEADDATLAGADAVVLLVDHDAFDPERIAASGTFVLDCKRRVFGPDVEVL